MNRRYIVRCLLFMCLAFTRTLHAEPVFKIGVSLPLSGALAEYGSAVQNGITLALETHPEKFRTVRFLFDDNRYDPKSALSSITKFVDVDGVQLLFMWGVEPAIAAGSVADRRKVPIVVVAQDAKIAEGRSFVMRFINPASDYSRLTLEELRRRGYRRIGLIKTELSFTDLMVDGFKSHLAPGEEFTVIGTLLPGESDLKPLLLRVREVKPEVLGLYLIPSQIIQYYRQAKALGISIPTFGTSSFESEAVLQESLSAMEGAFYVHGLVDDTFRMRYLKRFKDEGEISYAANAYEFALLAADLFGASGAQLSGPEVMQRLASAGQRSGAAGTFSYRETARGDRYFEFPLVAKRIENGQIRTP